MIRRCVALGAIVVLGLLLAGCYTDFGPVADTPSPIPPPAVGSYLQLGDRVTVTVYGEPDLTSVYQIDPNGNLDLPLIGTVRAAGRAPADLERTIAERYKAGHFLDQPKVTISVVEYSPIYIFGEVAHPGQFPYRTGLNAIAAVTEAGGLTYRGSTSSILIQHAGQQAWTEYPLVSSVTILPGDLVRVPERYF
jgi:protein involved in polysaccharide export with SLBB domain